MKANIQLFGGRGGGSGLGSGGGAGASGGIGATTMRDSSNGFEFSPERNKNTGTKLTRQPSAQDLIDAPAGTVFVSSTGTMYTKQSDSFGYGGSTDFTVKTMAGGTLSGISPNELAKKIENGKVTMARKRQASRRDAFGGYVPYA